ncbi:MAG: Hsp20/alpha crystallin family protein [Christensenellaceae bacterium]
MKNYLTRRNERNENFPDVWNDPFEDFFKPFFYGGIAASDMRTDIKETENGYEMQVDLPGFDKKDISVKLQRGYLTVNAEKQEKEEEGKHNYIRRERNYSCSRSYYVGESVKEEDVKAKYENGILTLCVPKETKEIPSGNISIE